jgi:hypothetical protein
VLEAVFLALPSEGETEPLRPSKLLHDASCSANKDYILLIAFEKAVNAIPVKQEAPRARSTNHCMYYINHTPEEGNAP